MARGHAFWVIVDGATPTAFRAPRSEDLLPTLRQLQRTQPAAVLRWFDGGRFWESPAAQRDAIKARRSISKERDREWRPGGQHADPRAKYQKTRDEKRATFKRRQRFGTSPSGTSPSGTSPSGNRPFGKSGFGKRPFGKSGFGKRPFGKSSFGKSHPPGSARPPRRAGGQSGPGRPRGPGGPRGPRRPR